MRSAPSPPAARLAQISIRGRRSRGEAIEGASVRYWRVADGTLQFLPGRLAISAGRDAGHEIRFVRTGGPELALQLEAEGYEAVAA